LPDTEVRRDFTNGSFFYGDGSTAFPKKAATGERVSIMSLSARDFRKIIEIIDIIYSVPDSDPVFFKSRSGTYRVRTLPLGRNGNGKVVLLERYPPEHRLQSKLEDSKLSRREKEIAVLTIQGYSNREIAEHSFICEQTVKDHLHTIFEKLEIRSRGELTAKVLGLRAGQLSL
jgi:DNA-binding CsgD family transcriptional regulator